ncbi:MAG: Fe-S cluster assembly ATPase SufC [Gammaproteobacteria bacterium]|nr:Fe-S cluster assembly ATPase SufC [Gammaproteobacteria bacterium]
MSLLEVSNLFVSVDNRDILKGVDLEVNAGEVHAIMGPNGSGKSTLANALAGRQGYSIESGCIRLDSVDVTSLEPEERSHRGLFMAFQYPVEIPGVTNIEFLKTAVESHRAAHGCNEISAVEFMRNLRSLTARLELNPDFLKRGVNESFSGGEKKRNEILQMLCLHPRIALLDETDSGLDIDALQVVARGINEFRSPANAIVLVTHYQRLLNYIAPDYVHVMMDGRVIKSGDASLALALEERGYGWLEES